MVVPSLTWNLVPFSTDGLAIMFLGIGLTTIPLVVVLYKRANSQRKKILEEARMPYTAEELRDMGDRSPHFRYML